MSRDPLPPAQAKEEVLAAFASKGDDHINCAQAVLRYWVLRNGQDTGICEIAAHLGGGVAGMGEVCGAVSGAALALGLRDHLASQAESPVKRAPTREQLQRLVQGFDREFGSSRCRDLTGVDLNTPEGQDTFAKNRTFDRCREFVTWMCDHLPQ